MYTIEDFKRTLVPAIEGLKREFGGIRTNRPVTTLIEDIRVSYYGQMLPVKQVGSVGVIPPREISVQVWDREAVQAVIKAIEAAQLGVSVQADGTVIHVRLPELSSERRAELAKQVKKVAEEYRIEVRHVRDEGNRSVERAFEENGLTEDQKFKLKELVQKEVERVNGEIEALVAAKVKEIME
jgi:ribosome recycling factor